MTICLFTFIDKIIKQNKLKLFVPDPPYSPNLNQQIFLFPNHKRDCGYCHLNAILVVLECFPKSGVKDENGVLLVVEIILRKIESTKILEQKFCFGWYYKYYILLTTKLFLTVG